MRRAAADPRGAQVSRAGSIPAPTGGWDAQNPLADMPQTNAVILDNFIPRPGYVEVRRGFVPLAINPPATPQALLTWNGPTGDKLLACAGSSIYDVTSTAGPFPTPLYTAATSPRWIGVNFANAAGAFTIAVNGLDTPIKFDGTAITATAITGTSGPITLDPKKLFALTPFKNHLHFLENGSLRVWYLGLSAISGAAGLLDLGPVFSKGGELACVGTWSFSAGNLIDDYIAYMTTKGQVAVFSGTDPSDATTWSLVSVYDLGYPLGPKSFVKYGADLVALTSDGVIPLSQALSLDRSKDNLVALTQRIQNAFHTATAAYQTHYGWSGTLYPKGSLAIYNVPTVEGVSSDQYVQNLQTGAWCRFTGLNATCWALANDSLYFCRADGIHQFDVGPDDWGNVITADLKTAFSGFGGRPSQKRFTMVRPLLYAPGVIQPALEMDVDYGESIPTAVPSVLDPSAVTPMTRTDWATVGVVGFVGAVRMRVVLQGGDVDALAVSADGSDLLDTDGTGASLAVADPIPFDATLQVNGFDVMYEPGGLL